MQNDYQEPYWNDLIVEARRDFVERIVVAAVVVCRERVLLLRRSEKDFMPGMMELPSGEVEKQETVEQALIREVLEETGMSILAIERYLGAFDYLGSSGARSRQLNFLVGVVHNDTVTLREHSGYCWASLYRPLGVSTEIAAILQRLQKELEFD